MEFSKKNIKIILGIITFGIVLFTVSQNLSAVAGFLSGVLKILAPVIVGFCLAFILNILMNFIYHFRCYGCSIYHSRNSYCYNRYT